MMKEIRESGYDKKLVYTYIRELLDNDKEIKENNNLDLVDNYLLDKNLRFLEIPVIASRAHSSLAKTFLQSYQGNWRNLSARILLESDFF